VRVAVFQRVGGGLDSPSCRFVYLESVVVPFCGYPRPSMPLTAVFWQKRAYRSLVSAAPVDPGCKGPIPGTNSAAAVVRCVVLVLRVSRRV
jgi:hypothetical protein